MVVSRNLSSNNARIPALGLRTLALMFLSILLMFLDKRDDHLNTARNMISAAVYPLRVIVDTPSRMWEWADEITQSRADLHIDNDRMRAENLLTQARLQRLNALEAENSRLRSMLDARDKINYRVRVAEIMAVDANPFRHSLIIDVGSSDGVYDGQAVVDAEGVVGQVIETGPMTAEAILISDPGHALPVEVNRNGLRTIAYGTGDFSRLDLPGLANSADIEVGDLLVTSGLGGAFPSGYPVAKVTAVNRIPQQAFADVSATPIVALDQVREVMLVWSSASDAKSATGEADE